MEEWLGEMRKGRRERMRKAAIVSSSPQGMELELKHRNLFFSRMIIKMSWCETECKNMCHW